MTHIAETLGEEYIKPDWDNYYGNHHKHLPKRDAKFGGGIYFSKYIGKPLSDDLWDDLLYRMNVDNLRIYKYNAAEWTDGRFSQHCSIYLDEIGNVEDIYYVF